MINRRSSPRPLRPFNFFSGHLEDTTTHSETLKVGKSPKNVGCTLILTAVILIAVLPVHAEAIGKVFNWQPLGH